MKTVILGMARSGMSALRFLQKRGDQVVCVDSNPALGFPSTASLHGVDLLVVSPGIPRTHPLYLEAQRRSIPVKGEAGLALESLKKYRIVGVTGSNGKTTLVSLITHILNSSGQKALALGNIGHPLCDFAIEPQVGVTLVVELSSYQLETLNDLVLDAAALLNITPNHHDRYRDFAEYEETKCHIYRCLKQGGVLFTSFELAGRFLGGEKVVGSDQIALDLCMHLGVSLEEFEEGMKTFKKPPHRIEHLGEIHGVSLYNDSKSTTLESTLYAISALEKPLILIAGGRPKSPDFTPWIEPFRHQVKGIIAIGEAAPLLSKQLCSYAVEEAFSLEEALDAALAKASPGMSVLLSPGCASFDWFRDYEDRGNQFRLLVEKRRLV